MIAIICFVDDNHNPNKTKIDLWCFEMQYDKTKLTIFFSFPTQSFFM